MNFFKNKKQIIIIFSGLLLAVFAVVWFVVASESNGTIDSEIKYAWNENAGWINFGNENGNVEITDLELSGYAWSENLGWISLNCSDSGVCATSDYKVENDAEGNLSGYGWNENAGWINFSPADGGVQIDSSGANFPATAGAKTSAGLFSIGRPRRLQLCQLQSENRLAAVERPRIGR